MSFSSHGVKFNARARKNWFFSFFVRTAELVLSVMFIIALGGVALMPQGSEAATGVSSILSYQGRLTDASGNPLGGSGTNYCAAFSIWDASSGGAKLWPTATSSTTILVTNGVFNAGIGVADDLSTYNFYDNNTTYLEVDIASQVGGTCTGVSWEALAPRPRIDATAYARVTRDVYGNLLRTDNANNKVQIGTGTGAATPILFNLDVKNVANSTLSYVGQTCTVNGTLWYNSATSKALLCENGLVRALANATTTVDALDITGNTAGTPATISNGTIVLAGGNNVTLSQNGNSITISGGQSVQTQNLHNVTLSGNTAGVMAQISSGTLTLAGGNNVTLSQNGNAMTISAFNQTAQTQNLHNVTLSGNTAGVMAQISSGTMTLAGGNNITLSQNGNAITISAGAGGGGGVAIGAGTQTATSGTVVFSNANGVTFGLNNQTLTASVNPGGGAAPNLSLWQHPRGVLLGGVGNITNITALSNRPFFVPAAFEGNITLKSLALQLSRAATGSNLFTVQYGLYTYVNSTQISLRGSCQETFNNSNTASVSGIRALWLTCLGTQTNASTVSPGNYVLGFYFSADATASMNYSIRGQSTANAWVLGQMYPGANIASTATSQGYLPMFGRYSTTQASPIAGSYAQSQIIGMGSAASLQIDPAISIRNF